MQGAINKIYSLALENNLGQDIISEWQQNVILMQSLLDTLGSKSHKTALKDLKKVFGGTRGLNEDNRRLVDSILRNSQRGTGSSASCSGSCIQTRPKIWPPSFLQPRPMAGTCHYCQLPGRECPTMRPFPSQYGPPMMEPFRPPFGGRGRGRTFGGGYFPRAPFPPRRGAEEEAEAEL